LEADKIDNYKFGSSDRVRNGPVFSSKFVYFSLVAGRLVMTCVDEFAVKEITVSRESDREERQIALYKIYQQVLERQPYAFERKQLAKAEADFLRNKIGVKRFLRILGQSDVYLNEFYYTSSNQKFIELCFKHFMGRAPADQDEVHEYCDILMRQGVHNLITAVLDSEDYRKHFGCFTVPHAWDEDVYPSPKTYWETEVLNHELHGRRGRILPTMVWHDLHMDCDGGRCDIPQASQPANEAVQGHVDASDISKLHQVLRSMNKADLDLFAATLSTTERQKLQQILR
jgi:phycoerythrin-associated linker protein